MRSWLFSMLLALQVASAQAFTVEKGIASRYMQHLFDGSTKNYVYRIPLRHVADFLPSQLIVSLKTRPVAALSTISFLPLKYNLLIWKNHALPHGTIYPGYTLARLFAELHLDTVHTYVVTDNYLIFTEAEGKHYNSFKDITSKHVILAGLEPTLRYAGEMIPTHHYHAGKRSFIFDNGSGTYTPKSEDLDKLATLLRFNLDPDPETEILAVSFKKKKHTLKRINRASQAFPAALSDRQSAPANSYAAQTVGRHWEKLDPPNV